MESGSERVNRRYAAHGPRRTLSTAVPLAALFQSTYNSQYSHTCPAQEKLHESKGGVRVLSVFYCSKLGLAHRRHLGYRCGRKEGRREGAEKGGERWG